MKYFALFLLLVGCVLGQIENGATGVITYFVMRDRTTEVRDTGITIGNLEMYYIEDQGAESGNVFSQAHGAITDAWDDGECIHVGHGVYRADWPDAAFDGGVGKKVQLTLVDGDAGAFTETFEYILSPPSNMVSISGDSTAADNFEAMFDGSGYNDDVAPATQLQVSTLAGGIAVTTAATDSTVTEGEETLTYAATATDDGDYYEVASDIVSDDIDFFLTFNTGDGMNLPVSFHLHGYYEDNNPPANSTMLIQSYDFNISDWETIYILSDSASDLSLSLPLHVHDVDPDGGNEGDVRIRFKLVATEVSQNIRIDHATVSYVTGGLTVAAIADGIWNAATNAYGGAGTYGQAVEDIVADTSAFDSSAEWLGLLAAVDTDATSATHATTYVTLEAGKVSNDAYNGMLISVTDADDSNVETRRIEDYTSGRKVTFDRALSFTPVQDDIIRIYGAAYDQLVAIAGGTANTYIVTDTGAVGGTGIADVAVWLTIDSAGARLITSGSTDDNGEVIFYLDSGVTYYVWMSKSGYSFSDNGESWVAD